LEAPLRARPGRLRGRREFDTFKDLDRLVVDTEQLFKRVQKFHDEVGGGAAAAAGRWAL